MPLKGRKKLDKAITKRIKEKDNALRGIFIQGLGNISGGTPVDEGRARNNWFLTLNSPANGVTSTTTGNTTNETRMPKSVLGKRLFYTNNLPYINVLEYGGFPGNGPKTALGYSDQAVGGWVRKELLVMRKAIRGIK